ILNGVNNVIGPVVDIYQPATQSIADKGLFFSRLSGDNLFQVALEISRSKGLSKILAEPTLTTLTGQPAEFLSGGEYPVPVPDDSGTRIQFKEYGVGLKFIPTILDKSRINLDLNISVSEINGSNNVTVSTDGTSQVIVVPSLNKRSASSTVELADGQTIGIAGLIQDNVSEVMSKLPGLGDIPILGALFRSQEFISGQSELVIFVTPHLAQPIAEEDIRLPTDSFVPPNDLEFYLLGKMEGDKAAPTGIRRHNLRGGFDGVKFGHQL
ncbi:MAG: type II and III secretion system protein family protein, partial [Gammaproteobacteria bacterium]|nr:type II and III secretion system protein family protein [Gammaproteobacteria bacterium]